MSVSNILRYQQQLKCDLITTVNFIGDKVAGAAGIAEVSCLCGVEGNAKFQIEIEKL